MTTEQTAPPDLRAGVYRHYKGHLYLVLGYGHDANYDGRTVVVYVGLELDGAKVGARLAVRTADDFLAIVDPLTGEAKDFPHPSPDFPLRFTYVGPTWNPRPSAVSPEAPMAAEPSNLALEMAAADGRMVTALRVLELLAMNNHDLCDSVVWRTDGEYAPITFMVMCSDVFSWGTADCEHVTPENFDVLKQALEDMRAACGDSIYGPELFVARLRGVRPQGAAYPAERELWPLFDACGPEREVGLGNPRPHPSAVGSPEADKGSSDG